MKRSAFQPFVSKVERAKIKISKPSAKCIKQTSKVSKDHPRGENDVLQERHQWSGRIDPEGMRGHVLFRGHEIS